MTSSINLTDFLTANKAFKKDFKDGGKPLPPVRKTMIVTCMDPRQAPAASIGQGANYHQVDCLTSTILIPSKKGCTLQGPY